jgi:hypothetical protein
MAAYTGITLNTAVKPLTAEQSRQSGFTHVATIKYTDFNTITGGTTGDTLDIAIGSTPTNFLIDHVCLNVKTAFTTLNTGTLTLSFGISSSTAVYIAAQSLLTAGAKAVTAGAVPAGATSTTGASSVTLSCRLTTGTSGVLTDVSTGLVDVYFRMVNLDTIDSTNY